MAYLAFSPLDKILSHHFGCSEIWDSTTFIKRHTQEAEHRQMAREQEDFSALSVVDLSTSKSLVEFEKEKEAYAPVNFISDEVYAMIAAFQARGQTRRASSVGKLVAVKIPSATAENNIAIEWSCPISTSTPPSDLPRPTRFKRSHKKIQQFCQENP